MRLNNACFILLACTLLAGVGPVSAQQMPALPSGVRIVLGTCESIVQKRALLDQLRIELLSTGVVDIEVVDPETGSSGHSANTERIATLQVYYPECDDTASLVNLRISDRLTAKYVERTLVVSDVNADARPRAVALAIVELLRASWLELVIAQSPSGDKGASDTVRNRLVSRLKEATDTDEEKPKPTRKEMLAALELARSEALEERWQKTRLEWLGGGRFYPDGDSGDLSTMVKLSFALNRRLRLHTGALAAGGGVNAEDDINIFAAAGVLGVSVAGGSNPEVEVASIFEVGWARLSGPEIADVSRVAAIGTLQGTLRTPVAAGVDAIVGLQAGYVLSPVVLKTGSGAERRIVGGLEGPVIGVVIGLAGIL